MTQDEKLWWSNFREANRPYIDHLEYKMVCEIHAKLFAHKIIYVDKCPACGYVQKYINEINEKFKQL